METEIYNRLENYMVETEIYKDAINKMCDLLTEARVPYTLKSCYEGWQLRFPWHEGDVACHTGTYGSNTGKVESYQFPWDEGCVTMDTPEKMVKRIVQLYTLLKYPQMDWSPWQHNLFCVVNPDGTYAGEPCVAYEEALELSYQRTGRMIFKLEYVDPKEESEDKNEI